MMEEAASRAARLAAVLVLSCLSAGHATASPPTSPAEPVLLAFQTRLHTIGGPHAGSEAEITFRIHDGLPNGPVLWTQGPQTVSLRDGFFRTVLGDGGAPLSLEVLTGDRWLELDCDGCTGRRLFRISRRGEAVAIEGAERPVLPGPAAPKPLLRNQRLHDQRAYPTGIVPAGALPRAFLETAGDPLSIQPPDSIDLSPSALTQGAWTSIGPSKVAAGQTAGTPRGDVSGRVNSIAVHPNDPNIVYACGAQGGVWKTIDAGTTWTSLTDGLPSLASGAVAIASSDPNVVYLGTGEANFSLDSYWGAGVFKSLDGGATWSVTAVLDPNRAPLNATAIAAMAIHPADPNVVLAGAGTFLQGNRLFSGGVYRSSDGGASWIRALGPGLPTGPIVASDLLIDPADPNKVYAALGYVAGSANNGVYKSTDGGVTFTKLAGGLPTTNVGRINIAIARSNTQVLYASVQDISNDGLLGIWRTLDGGANWSKRTASTASCGIQCWYDMVLVVHPTTSDMVFFGGVQFYRSTNGAQTFSLAIEGGGPTGGMHVDQHALVYSPSLTDQLWVGNDGGVWRTDASSAALPLNWVNANTNLALLQFQSVAVPPADPNIAYGGTQDNGTNKYTGGIVWSHVADGDGGQTAVDYVVPQTVYHAFYGVSFARSDNGGGTWATKQTGLNTGDRSQFYVPVEIDPTASAVLYLGTYRLYRTASRGDSWSTISGDLSVNPTDPNSTGSLSAIGIAKTDGNVIYTGSSNAQVYVTSNLGGLWTNRTAAPLPMRFVTSIAVHPTSADVAFVAYSGFDDPNSGFGHVFKTSNRGVSWTDVTSNLPDIPVNQITIDPVSPQMIYLATDIGPYASTNGGQTWRRYAGAFPNVATFEIAVQQPNLLFAATHGRGMFQAFGCTASGTTDADADGVADFCDNCVGTANASQIDADADGYGAACDCADGDGNRHPGAPESCNGLDDDCDGSADLGSAPPGEPGDDLQVVQNGDVAWGGTTLTEHYNVYRGTMLAGSPVSYNHTCFSPAVPVNELSDPSVPPSGTAFYYLVSSENCLAESGLGSGDSGPRPNSNPCP